MFNFDEAGKKSKEAVDTMLKGYSETTKGFQAIAAESTEYSKKSFQDVVTHFEALSSVRSIETAVELQTGFVKSAFESFFAEATKLSEMYGDIAKTVYKPFEAPFAKAMNSVTPAA